MDENKAEIKSIKLYIEAINDFAISKDNANIIKGYIGLVQKYLKGISGTSEEKTSIEEIKSTFLEEYKKEIASVGPINELYSSLVMYGDNREFERMQRHNVKKYNRLYDKAINDNEDDKDSFFVYGDVEQRIVKMLKYYIRQKRKFSMDKKINKDEITGDIKRTLKEKIVKDYKNTISNMICFFDSYGLMDEYIKSTNKSLEESGLSNLMYDKRMPSSDRITEKGPINHPDDVIGILDAFSSENISSNILPEDILMLITFWQNRYCTARYDIAEALHVINELDLWEMLITGNESDISSIDESLINNITQKCIMLNEIISYNPETISKEAEKEYNEYLNQKGLLKDSQESSMQKDIILYKEFIGRNLGNFEISNDRFKYILIEWLQTKKLQVTDWGISTEQKEGEYSNIVYIDNPRMRMPTCIVIKNSVLEEFMRQTKTKKLPTFKGGMEITSDEYVDIIGQICIPNTQRFSERLKAEYEASQTNKTKASNNKSTKARIREFER